MEETPQEPQLGPARVLHQSKSEKEVWHYPNIRRHLTTIPMDLYKNLKQQISQRVRLNLVRVKAISESANMDFNIL